MIDNAEQLQEKLAALPQEMLVQLATIVIAGQQADEERTRKLMDLGDSDSRQALIEVFMFMMISALKTTMRAEVISEINEDPSMLFGKE